MNQVLPMPGSADDASWHALPAEEVLQRLATDLRGLTSAEAERRLEQHGRNRLPAQGRRSALTRFLLQFHNILIYILLVAATVTALLGEWVDTSVILGVVIVNAIVGFIQEGRAERAMEAVREILAPEATAIRDGVPVVLPAEELVPGDIVVVRSGDKVPADMRLARARNLQIQEAALTGESLPTSKEVGPAPVSCTLGDRASMAYSATIVTYGQATGIVVATGPETEIGKISGKLGSIEALKTPLLRRLEGFSRWLSAIILVVSAATFAFGTLVRGLPAEEMFLAAVSLAVSAIPEGLPAIMTIALAIGVQRMAVHHAIIRRLPAVETLGSATVICSDKTGTLTRNELTVRTVLLPCRDIAVEGVGYEPKGGFLQRGQRLAVHEDRELLDALRMALLCCDSTIRNSEEGWAVVGDPTEGALVVAAAKAGLDQLAENEAHPRIDAIPFEALHRFMATLHRSSTGERFIVAKGAPERILEMCNTERSGGERPLDVADWHKRLDELADQGQRLLAVAVKPAPPGQEQLEHSHIDNGFELLAAFGLIDPPRAEAKRAVQDCHRAGIIVKMITGDHTRTARSISRELGIASSAGRVMNGRDLDKTSDEDLRAVAREVHVFARASPEHKLRLVEALQADGHVVAMTGDGVNDAPALKRADIGAAMGRKGTEAAKEASEMVLADDNFATVAAAVREGRVVYDNLQKAILHILPTNGGEVLTVIAAILLGYHLPMTPVQILWVNMVTTVALSLALAFEPAERDVMARPPRPMSEPIVTRFGLWRMLLVTVLMSVPALGLFVFDLGQGAPLEEARTATVNMIVMAEAFYLFNGRFLRQSSLSIEGLFGSRPVLIAVGVVLLLQAAFTYLPQMQFLFGTQGLSLVMWGRILAVGLLIFLAVELEKAIRRAWNGRAGRAG
ncbi:MAG: cation-transporting P-type ATPase [Hyphomicrobiaceae bacterium]|nr:cation-transporting P-type ATPase [Hyphomicrobiaceae bacterium]